MRATRAYDAHPTSVVYRFAVILRADIHTAFSNGLVCLCVVVYLNSRTFLENEGNKCRDILVLRNNISSCIE